jgi:hypothetical protein
VANFKCYLFNQQDHIVKRCDLTGDDLDLVVVDARAALRQEAAAAKFEIWQGARLLYTESAQPGESARYSTVT